MAAAIKAPVTNIVIKMTPMGAGRVLIGLGAGLDGVAADLAGWAGWGA